MALIKARKATMFLYNLSYKPFKKWIGFSLVELMITACITSLVLTASIKLFISVSSHAEHITKHSELIENARLALNIIREDVLQAGHWGAYKDSSWQQLKVKLNKQQPYKPKQLKNLLGSSRLCSFKQDNNEFFPTQSSLPFIWLYGGEVNKYVRDRCLSKAVLKREFIQIKHAGELITSDLSVPDKLSLSDSAAYLLTKPEDILLTTGASIRTSFSKQDLEKYKALSHYQHHIYYVTRENRGDFSIPVLNRNHLYFSQKQKKFKMKSLAMVEGIEYISFVYGVDLNFDGVVDSYINKKNFNRLNWHVSKIINIKISVIARTLQPSLSVLQPKDEVYDLGSEEIHFKASDANNYLYQRLLLSTVVSI